MTRLRNWLGGAPMAGLVSAGLVLAGASVSPILAQDSGPNVLKSATIDAVRARGKLICGVNDGLIGFSAKDSSGEWHGFETDICRAVAAAVLGDAGTVSFVPLDTNTRFSALEEKRVDFVARNTTWTMERQVKRGFTFAGISFFDGQGFAIHAESGVVSALQLSGHRVCVVKGTTTEDNMAVYFAQHRIVATSVPVVDHAALLTAYLKGDCDAYSTDHSTLFSDRAAFQTPSDHVILPEQISKEPLSLMVRGDDPVWAEVVRWVLYGLINAEEYGLSQDVAKSGRFEGDARRLVEGSDLSGVRLGFAKGWLVNTVAAIGNYGELFERNVGEASPLGMRRGMNALWRHGGILYAPPMW